MFQEFQCLRLQAGVGPRLERLAFRGFDAGFGLSNWGFCIFGKLQFRICWIPVIVGLGWFVGMRFLRVIF